VARPSGLVSWWKGESNAVDALGANNGTVNGNVTFAAAEVKNGFVFDGTTSYVNMGSVTGTSLDVGTADFTVEFWLKTSSDLNPTQFVVGDAGVGQAQGWRVLYQAGVNHQLRFRIANATTADIVDTAPVNDGMWHHFAFVRSADSLLAYEDGVQAASLTTAITDITTASEFHLGGRSTDWFFEGSLDEVSVYSRALSAAEIAGIFAAGNLGKC
jgi:Concanavalin A-like lectin/glucanases superfamily